MDGSAEDTAGALQAGQDGMEEGRSAVRVLLVNRLRDAGLRPRKGVTEAMHSKQMDHLVEWLGYMAPDNLRTLAESILHHAAQPGPGQGIWPAEVLVRGWAEALQPKPFDEHPIIASWLRSREGPMADAGGYLVELLRWLRRHRRPLTPADMAVVRREASEMQGVLARVRERIAKGVPWADDHDTLSRYMADLHQARQFVQAGQDRRAAQDAATQGQGRAA